MAGYQTANEYGREASQCSLRVTGVKQELRKVDQRLAFLHLRGCILVGLPRVHRRGVVITRRRSRDHALAVRDALGFTGRALQLEDCVEQTTRVREIAA